jgi:hypothetical protein
MGIIGLIPLIHLTIKYNTVDIKRITYVIGGFYMLISGLIITLIGQLCHIYMVW